MSFDQLRRSGTFAGSFAHHTDKPRGLISILQLRWPVLRWGVP